MEIKDIKQLRDGMEGTWLPDGWTNVQARVLVGENGDNTYMLSNNSNLSTHSLSDETLKRYGFKYCFKVGELSK